MTYVVRLYEGWQVWDAQIAEMTISAPSIEEAQKLAEKIANGRAFSCNKAWEKEEEEVIPFCEYSWDEIKEAYHSNENVKEKAYEEASEMARMNVEEVTSTFHADFNFNLWDKVDTIDVDEEDYREFIEDYRKLMNTYGYFTADEEVDNLLIKTEYLLDQSGYSLICVSDEDYKEIAWCIRNLKDELISLINRLADDAYDEEYQMDALSSIDTYGVDSEGYVVRV